MNKYVKRMPPDQRVLDPDRVGMIAKNCNTYPVLVQALLNRGFKEDEVQRLIEDGSAKEFFHRPLKGAYEAAVSILKHLEANHTIAIFADYDCDGITSGYVMYSGLKAIAKHIKSKSSIVLHYPQRKDGYGLSLDYCKEAADNHTSCVITVDNGIATKKEQQYLSSRNVELIVTDHHEPSREKLPECIIVDPCFSDLTRTYLAGVAVAANVIVTLADKVGHSIDYARFTPPVAIGTISDCMPMTYENACYIKEGLSYMNEGNACRFLEDLSKDIGTTPVDVSFDIAPLINSASRMGDTRIGASGFFTDEEDKVNSIITKLNELNNARKKATNDAKEAVKSIQIEPWERIVMYDGKGYQKGIHGIIAGEISKQYNEYPAFVYCAFPEEDTNRIICAGSVRCQNEALDCIDLFDQLKSMGYVKMVAGHSSACVLQIYQDKMDSFRKAFASLYDDMELPPVVKTLDASLSLKAAYDTNLLRQLRDIPFTTQELPVFGISNVMINRVYASKNNPNNIQLFMADSTAAKSAWAWGWGEKYKKLGSPNEVHLVCSIQQDFRSKTTLQPTLHIIDMIPVHRKKDAYAAR